MAGAQKAQNELCSENIDENDVLKYAAVRNVFYNKGTKLECFVSYEPCMAMFNEWLKQLFAESEGKDGKGLFPVSCISQLTFILSVSIFRKAAANLCLKQ